jgi:hypothetical protein
MDYWVILYTLICVVVGGSVVAFLYKRGQTMGSMVFLVLVLLVFIFFGLRWFPGGNLNGTKPQNVPWPPIVNMCPDFTVTWTHPETKDIYCYDAANIYGLKTATGPAPVVASNLTINGTSGQSGIKLKTGSNPQKFTKLSQDSAGTVWPILKSSNLNSMITSTPSLRWEGVWDGRTLTPAAAPLA